MYFGLKKASKRVWYTSENKIFTSLFVQKPYLITNYIEASIEESIDIKNKFKIKKSSRLLFQ